ncbi:MAG TPA: hypothetical protein VF490_03850, partial [Chryseosolibacter sp.]
MSTKSKFLVLHSLVSYMPSEDDGDEIYITYKGKKVAPKGSSYYRMPNGELAINVEIPLAQSEEWAELELWDHDLLSRNDQLGSFRLKVDEVDDGFSAELIQKEPRSRYVLNWGV